MNTQLENFAREAIKDGLAQLEDKYRQLFKRMYSHGDPEAEINDVVDLLDVDTLNSVMNQVQRTVDKMK